MTTRPTLDPLIWRQLPADTQRMLSGYDGDEVLRHLVPGLNLFFNDDGSLATSPANAGYELGLILIERFNVMDAVREATLFTESLTRRAMG